MSAKDRAGKRVVHVAENTALVMERQQKQLVELTIELQCDRQRNQQTVPTFWHLPEKPRPG